MATKTVVVEITTKPVEFPLGTEDSLFKFELLENGNVISFVETSAWGATFPEVPEGKDYVARVSKRDVVLTHLFTIPLSTATLLMPDVITVTFNL